MGYKENKLVFDDALAFTHKLAEESFQTGGDKIDVKRLARLMALAVMRSKDAISSKPSLDLLKKLDKVGYIESTEGTVYFSSAKNFLSFRAMLPETGSVITSYCNLEEL